MTERPPGFKQPQGTPRHQLFLYFGYGDYVAATSAVDAAAEWGHYFDADGAMPDDFVVLPDDEVIEILFEGDYTVASLETIEAGNASLRRLPARKLLDLLGPGYIASTQED